jgi:hypothetical protein
MSVSTSFYTSENKITDDEASYTGSLPEEFIPLLGAGQRRTDSYSDFSNNDYIGPDPRFLTPTTNVIEAYYLSQIGKDFNFYTYSSSVACTTEFSIYGWCEGREISSGNSYSNGYATLNSVEVVQTPIPTAAWLFGSALLGLAGIKRKK